MKNCVNWNCVNSGRVSIDERSCATANICSWCHIFRHNAQRTAHGSKQQLFCVRRDVFCWGCTDLYETVCSERQTCRFTPTIMSNHNRRRKRSWSWYPLIDRRNWQLFLLSYILSRLSYASRIPISVCKCSTLCTDLALCWDLSSVSIISSSLSESNLLLFPLPWINICLERPNFLYLWY